MSLPHLPPPSSLPPAAERDRTTVWGVLGIALSLVCCSVLGIVFGYLSIRDARRYGQSQVLGYVSVALGVARLVLDVLLAQTGNYPV